jgi:hypothetical protein
MSVNERFWSRVDKTGGSDACWPWITNVSGHGYGWAHVGGGRYRYAHRLAWELTGGPIPVGLFVCHRCDNRICVNPAHLFLGTPAENNADRDAKGRGARGTKTWSAKLNEELAEEIRGAWAFGSDVGALATRFGVSKTTVRDVVRRRRWSSEAPDTSDRRCKRIEFRGQVLSITELSRICGISQSALSRRLVRGLSAEEAATMPLHRTLAPRRIKMASKSEATERAVLVTTEHRGSGYGDGYGEESS